MENETVSGQVRKEQVVIDDVAVDDDEERGRPRR
ncbi:hypothetical protein QF026_002035 [Streptomyces aurantiacus]|nr:hypothetical protein [Streptomyces aurantiacus]